jgi:hypothetical protein
MAGRCYQRTSNRTGNLEDGHALPNGSVEYYLVSPDPGIQGRWMIAGRIVSIDHSYGLMYIKARGDDTIVSSLGIESPYSYSRMWTMETNVPWREAMPEVRPQLGKDIVVGDYIWVSMSGPGVEIKNWKSEDENYQALLAAQSRGAVLPGVTIQIIQ